MRSGAYGDALARVDRFLDGLSPKRLSAARINEAMGDLQLGALRHPDPQIRRYCLVVLDHYANDASMQTFVSALEDDTDAVREIALHSLACEPCKRDALCPTDVVPALARVLASDPKPDLRIKALTALLRVHGDAEQLKDLLRRTAESNSDPVTRRCAEDALRGQFVPPKKRYERSQRRQPSLGSSSLPTIRE